MTALNLIVQPAAGVAWLLTDTGCYEPSGVIAEFASKVLPLQVRGRTVAALATTGMASQRHFAPHFARLAPRTLDELLSAVPGIFAAVERELVEQGRPDTCGCPYMGAVVAAYDRYLGKPLGFVIANGHMLLPRGAYEPYVLQPARRYLTRFVGEPFPRGNDLSLPEQWDPQRDALALIEAQRRDTFGADGREFLAVGGKAVLTRIDARGVRKRTLKRWPDRVGQRIQHDERLAA